ncbi:MAG: hemolysin family protein [Microscillaceae bacterium]|nr:hemolysin family protein [Microscillaceae bacterium]MDW8461672.1 hemolysin family protein [Cytophagales bacterium]
MIIDILLTIFLVALNGFFVAAEFAIVKVRSSQLDLKTHRDATLARIAKHITSHLDAYLAATQLGITIASIGLGFIGEEVAKEVVLGIFHYFHIDINPIQLRSLSTTIAFVFITFMHVVFGELVPKSFAIRYSLPTTIAVALPLRFFYFVFVPFIWTFNGFANFVLNAIGVPAASHESVHSEEELRILIEESSKEGEIEKSTSRLLDQVFKFDDKFVKQIMMPKDKIVALDIDTPLQEVISTAIFEGYSRIPLYQGDINNIKGLLYTKDLLKLLANNHEITSLHDLRMPIHTTSPNKRVGDLLEEFQKKRRHMAVVKNDAGELIGLVTIEDIIEELLGEIYDETDESNIIAIGEGEYMLSGLLSVSELNKILPEACFPESEYYETVSGMLLNFIGQRTPRIGETVLIQGYEFTILKKKTATSEKIAVVQMKVPQNAVSNSHDASVG